MFKARPQPLTLVCNRYNFHTKSSMSSVTIFIFLGKLRLKMIGINVEVGTV